MARGIDHLVIAVRALDGARSLYERLGFTLTPKARHPFGTENSLAQLEGCFLELLGLHDPRDIPVPKPGEFSFARFNQRYLARREGLSMLVLESADAEADALAFAKAGLQSYLPFEFGREARQPDGSTARVGFRLAFATDPDVPEAGFFACQQLAPEYFWKPDYQRHANTARTITEVVMIAEKPKEHGDFFEGFTGVSVHQTPAGLMLKTPRGCIAVIAPGAALERWGAAIDPVAFDTPRFAAFAIGVDDLDAAENRLDEGAVAHTKRDGRLVVPADEAMGVAVAFEAV
jgi:catechol 2,3-dioxygenase-like lactoylglutathione lyase family enzyme